MRAEEAITMPGPLRVVSERFPSLKDQAIRRFTRDESFRDLCEDYEACADTLARFESGKRGPEGLRNEYAALLLRLEHEMLRHLREHMDRDDG
jgi:hypothetical protein